ncbi:unnamed protein product [Mytilus edulis]|uniref:TIR domain-containing protein n=1 Tax=Mytilus edulis TaxID=6550 RepID=A0A8S3Q1Z0_MYTED|nr:unnamed protein product [Mytilus edulis]
MSSKLSLFLSTKQKQNRCKLPVIIGFAQTTLGVTRLCQFGYLLFFKSYIRFSSNRISDLQAEFQRLLSEKETYLVRTPRMGEIREKISKSKNILIILSVYDDASKRWLCELRYSWINYRIDWRKNIVIVNYDFLETNKISCDFIQAFFRLGKCVDFSNYQKDIQAKIFSL